MLPIDIASPRLLLIIPAHPSARLRGPSIGRYVQLGAKLLFLKVRIQPDSYIGGGPCEHETWVGYWHIDIVCRHFSTTNGWGWGPEGHRTIAQLAVETLPPDTPKFLTAEKERLMFLSFEPGYVAGCGGTKIKPCASHRS